MAEPAKTGSGLFREEAVEYHVGRQGAGDLLRISPAWTRWSYWIMLAVLLVGAVYSILGTVHEYATGPAVVRVEGRNDITAVSEGTVAAVEVQPGQRVSPGQLLVRFYVAQEISELENINRQFELQLIKVLKEPTDQQSRAALTTLRAQRELAQARVEERSVKAPYGGVVSDIRIRTGQRLAPGDTILSLVGDEARFSVIAMLPGQYRPMLRAGMTLRLELAGFRYAYRDLTIEAIGDEVVGPNEVRRFLGQELADVIPLSGPVILVQASLPTRTFVSDGREFNYFNGMHGSAEARVRSQSILVTLVPALRAFVEGRGG